MTFYPTDSGATISDDQKYRYLLWREWKGSGFRKPFGTVLFVMLNPSTADGKVDDPTIRRCIDFAQQRNMSRLEVVNLFAWRATEPKDLLKVDDPVGPLNDDAIKAAAKRANLIVCAWGTMGWINDRAKYVKAMLELKHPLYAFGFTQGKHPKHPLYLAKDTKLVRFR